MAKFKVDTTPEVLIWARESIGLSLDVAAKKMGVSRTEIQLWEEGVEDPSIAQLRKMAEVYKRPLAVLLLPESPKGFDAIKDFRLLQKNQDKSWSPDLHKAFWRVQMQREVAEELADLADETPLPIDLTVSVRENPESVGETIRTWLGVPVWGADDSLHKDDLNQWIDLIEAKTILVTQIPGVNLEEMRGCSISEQPFPVIVLNGADSPRGKVFTLMHELVHILLHAGGLCNLEEIRERVHSDTEQIERFCNQVAAAILMPRIQLLRDQRIAVASSATQWSDEDLGWLADAYGVSREAMLLRLVSLERASWEYYFDRRSYFLQVYEDARREQKAKGGGPNYYRMKLRNFGRRYTSTVLDAYYRRDITISELSDYLDMKLNNVPRLEELLEAR